MGGPLWFATDLTVSAFTHGLAQAAILLGLIAAAVAAYGGLLALLGVAGWREVVNALGRGKTGDLRP
jgi:uncharacterized PurR-regulated membrane protein YhhQ (DUF165 family)